MGLKGRAWKFGDNITTDYIAPSRYMHLRSNLSELAKHAFEDIRPEFPSSVKPGDLIVAGRNFGAGSSREHAPIVIKMLGVSVVIAKSFARIFYRNAINVGLPLAICDTSIINDGDLVEVDLQEGIVKNLTKKAEMRFKPLPEEIVRILSEGGIVNYVKKHGGLDF
ncbi:MAG: 3-isopropylmalate dehydratase small subunit [Candidatus Bathyarchaeia archaeon]